MKLHINGNNINVRVANTKDEDIYTYQVDRLNVELDIIKLVESFGDIVQTVKALVELANEKPTPAPIDDDAE